LIAPDRMEAPGIPLEFASPVMGLDEVLKGVVSDLPSGKELWLHTFLIVQPFVPAAVIFILIAYRLKIRFMDPTRKIIHHNLI